LIKPLHRVTRISISSIISVFNKKVSQQTKLLQRQEDTIRVKVDLSHLILVYTKAMEKYERTFQKNCVRGET